MRCSVPLTTSDLRRNVFDLRRVVVYSCSISSSSHARLLRVTAMMQWNLPCGQCGTTCAPWLVHPCSPLTLAPPPSAATAPRTAAARRWRRCTGAWLVSQPRVMSLLSAPTLAQRKRGWPARLAPVLARGEPFHPQGLRLVWLRVRARAAAGARTRLPFFKPCLNPGSAARAGTPR